MTSEPPFLVHGFMLADTKPSISELLEQHQSAVIEAGTTTKVMALASRLTAAQSAALDDPEAVTALAVMHAARLGAVAAATDIVPLKFGTFASSEAAVSGICDGAEPLVRAALARIAGKVEFGIRISLRAAPDQEPPAEAANGRQYLRSRAEKRANKRSSSDTGRCFASGVWSGLSAICVAQNLLTVDVRAEGALLMNAACLVNRSRTAEFLSAVEVHEKEADRLGIDLIVTGPWPAFSFVADNKERDLA